MSTLKERAQTWLDYYKASSGDVFDLPTPETIAAVFAEYLHGTEENILEKSKELKNENELLREMHAEVKKELADIKTRLNTSELTRESLASDLFEARGKIKAYEFVIRGNGVSGAEV